MSVLPEAVERQQLRFFDVRLAFRSTHVSKDVDCEATVAILLPPHLEAKPDVAGFEDVRATVVFDGIALGYEGFSGAGLHVRQNALHRSEISGLHNIFVAGALEHLRELLTEDADCPADGITIDDRIHAAMHAHAAADTVGGRQLRVIRTIDVASLDVEAVEAEQRGFLAANFGRHVDGYTLVHMILDIAIPQLVSDDEGHAIGGKSGSLRLWHARTLRLRVCDRKDEEQLSQGGSPPDSWRILETPEKGDRTRSDQYVKRLARLPTCNPDPFSARSNDRMRTWLLDGRPCTRLWRDSRSPCRASVGSQSTHHHTLSLQLSGWQLKTMDE